LKESSDDKPLVAVGIRF